MKAVEVGTFLQHLVLDGHRERKGQREWLKDAVYARRFFTPAQNYRLGARASLNAEGAGSNGSTSSLFLLPWVPDIVERAGGAQGVHTCECNHSVVFRNP